MYQFDNVYYKQFEEHYKKNFLLKENEECRLEENQIKNKKKRGY